MHRRLSSENTVYAKTKTNAFQFTFISFIVLRVRIPTLISCAVAAGIGLLPVSLGINSATEMVSATACILWPGAPGHVGGFLAHGHLRESDLQWPVSTVADVCAIFKISDSDDLFILQRANSRQNS